MATYDGHTDIWDAPTKVIPQATRQRALLPPLTPERVQKIAEDPEATGPIGLDPESIGAVRRLWRHFNSHGCGR